MPIHFYRGLCWRDLYPSCLSIDLRDQEVGLFAGALLLAGVVAEPQRLSWSTRNSVSRCRMGRALQILRWLIGQS
mgnify:CR=1 FL=1